MLTMLVAVVAVGVAREATTTTSNYTKRFTPRVVATGGDRNARSCPFSQMSVGL